MIWSLKLPFVLYRIYGHINLVPWVLFDTIERPGVVVPNDSVIGIRIVITAVHLKEMGALMLRCFWKIAISYPFVFPWPIKGKHVGTKGFVSVGFDKLCLQTSKPCTFLYVNIRWETIPIHHVLQRFDGCIRLPTECMKWAPGPVHTIFKECFKERYTFLNTGNTVHITLGNLTMTLGVVVKKLIADVARPIRQVVIQICHVQKIPVYTGIILPSHSNCC